jgi:hypothetical protein
LTQLSFDADAKVADGWSLAQMLLPFAEYNTVKTPTAEKPMSYESELGVSSAKQRMSDRRQKSMD